MSYFNKENKAVPRVEEKAIPKGLTYSARFITAGPVGYKDGVYLLPQNALDSFAYTLKGCPVVVGHQDIIDQKDMEEKAVGYVSNVHRCEESGDWFADFVIFDEKTNKKIENGELPYVSCAYKADLTEEDCTINNVQYKKRIVGGEMVHLALVKNPRYNGTDIWRNSADDYLIGEPTLYNQKENIMFGFKKTKTELDKDIMIETSRGEMSIEELVNAISEADEQIAEKDQKIKDLEAAQQAAEEKAAADAAKANEAAEAKEKASDEKTDADFKKDLKNSLKEEHAAKVVAVPNVKI